ncbi:hypothetical protein KSC_052320 [Ktedonobacter sp. SOSP1-52]|nr:hypothetical protein KSC_052320 [Ktedonobacter sp. SOSP1-52]
MLLNEKEMNGHWQRRVNCRHKLSSYLQCENILLLLFLLMRGKDGKTPRTTEQDNGVCPAP